MVVSIGPNGQSRSYGLSRFYTPFTSISFAMSIEYYGRVLDTNFEDAKEFQALLEFKTDNVLITSLDARLGEHELYVKSNPDTASYQQLSYQSIRYIMKQGCAVTFVGLRNRIQFTGRANYLNPIEREIGNIEDDCETEFNVPDGELSQVFVPVQEYDIHSIIGPKEYRKFKATNEAVGKRPVTFWFNRQFQEYRNPLINQQPGVVTFEKLALLDKARDGVLMHIAMFIRSEINENVHKMRIALNNNVPTDIDAMIAQYEQYKRENFIY